ncbi:TolC family protein [Desulforegula conservatrix]|uniref:TolC family protein n=1 Tax=Desulforegula conservatrix TaxID=153026 RepID=UPI0003FB8612|nr:TolC family protein [Desulforegula conservatrix]
MKRFTFLTVFVFAVFSACLVHAEKLTYDDILKDALNNSLEIKSANIEKDIRKEAEKEGRYGLYPDLSLKFNSEYTDNFTDGMGDIAIGDTMISGSTRYQNALSVNLMYPIIDYGGAANRLEIAKTEADQGENMLAKTKMDLETSVLEKYSSLFAFYSEAAKRREIISIHEKIAEAEKRSGVAGLSGKHDVLYQDILLAEEKEKLDVLKTQISVALNELEYFTGKKYSSENLEVERLPEKNDLEEINKSENSDHTTNPEYKYFTAEKKKKQIENDIVRSEFYPKLNVYARYNFYSSANDSQDSFDNIREKGYAVGLFTSFPITENLKRVHSLEKSRLSVNKADTEASKKLAEIERDFSKLSEQYQYLKTDVEKKKTRLGMINSRHEMIKRLESSKVVAKKDLLEEMIMLATKEIELEKQITDQTMAMKKIIIQMRGGN